MMRLFLNKISDSSIPQSAVFREYNKDMMFIFTEKKHLQAMGTDNGTSGSRRA